MKLAIAIRIESILASDSHFDWSLWRSVKPLLQEVGVQTVRVVLDWRWVQVDGANEYNWNSEYYPYDSFFHDLVDIGIEPFVVLLSTPSWAGTGSAADVPNEPERFGEFCFKAANRYRPLVNHWEVWNEPNLGMFWDGTLSEFTRLLAIANESIKSAYDPVVISGGLAHSPSVVDDAKEMRDSAFGLQCDGFGIHANTWGHSPLESGGVGYFDVVDLVAEEITIPLWLTEQHTDANEHGEDLQAVWFYEGVKETQRRDLPFYCYFDLMDHGGLTTGLLHDDLSKRRAFNVYKQLAGVFI